MSNDATPPTLRAALDAGLVALPDGIAAKPAAPGDSEDAAAFVVREPEGAPSQPSPSTVLVTYDRSGGLFFLSTESTREGVADAVQAAQEFAFTLEGARPKDCGKVLERLAAALSGSADCAMADNNSSDRGDDSDAFMYGEDDEDDDEGMGEDLDDDLKHSLRVKRRCTERDARLKREAEEARAAKDPDTADGKAAAAEVKSALEEVDDRVRAANQIFSSDEATGLLLSELESAICMSRAKLWYVDTVEDDAAHWRAELFFSRFDSDGNEVTGDARRLAGQLEQVGSLHGCSSVEVEVSFHRDLYPFYPPSVRLVRPRFANHMIDRLSSLSAGWGPCKRVSELLDDVRDVLLTGDVDVECGMNSKALHPEGAYPAAMFALCELGRASQTMPRVQLLRPSLFPSDRPTSGGSGGSTPNKRSLESTPTKDDSEAKRAKTKWAKGTGYGSGGNPGGKVWDVKKYEVAEQRRHEETNALLRALLNDLRRAGSAEVESDAALLTYAPTSAELAHRTDNVLSEALPLSALSPFIVKSLSSASWLEMGKRPRMYATLFAVIHLLACDASLAACLFVDTRKTTNGASDGAGSSTGLAPNSVASVLAKSASSARLFLKTLGEAATGVGVGDAESIAKATEAAKQIGTESSELDAPLARCIIAASAKVAEIRESAEASLAEAEAEAARSDQKANVDLNALLGNCTPSQPAGRGERRSTRGKGKKAKEEGGGGASGGASANGGGAAGVQTIDAEAAYADAVRDLIFDSCELTDVPATEMPHTYAKDAAGAGGGQDGGGAIGSSSRERMRRLAHDTVVLSNSLPLSKSSTIMLRVDDARPDLLRAVITGPEDTPYAAGAFVFDIGFPARYPDVPPTVKLCTTGRGTVRFNPNLYDSGKVCLSLLGTWSGADGETWSKQSSTLLQVFVSIQSLILVPSPYYNEPGYEGEMGTPNGNAKSASYNDKCKIATVRWAMIEALDKPMAGTAEFTNAHFKAKRDEVLAQVEGWIDEAKARGGGKDGDDEDMSGAHNARAVASAKEVVSKLKEMLPKLKKLLKALGK